MKHKNLCQKRTLKNGVSLIFATQKIGVAFPVTKDYYKNKVELKYVSEL